MRRLRRIRRSPMSNLALIRKLGSRSALIGMIGVGCLDVRPAKPKPIVDTRGKYHPPAF
jgi:hypothetical protein